jgi:DNA-binding CsgD family transcriptional regulator/PAS domain-containing protein
MGSGNENGLVEALYDAALGQRSWQEVGRQVTDHLQGMTLQLSVHDSRSAAVDVVAWLGMPREHLREYGEHFAQHDLWAQGAANQRAFGKALAGTEVVEERVLTTSFIYNEFLLPKVNVHHLVGSLLPLSGGYQGVVGIHRPRDASDFAPEEVEQLNRLLPHLQRALEVRQKLRLAEETNRSFESALDRLSVGVIMLGAPGRLLHVNAAADAILRQADGLLRTPDGLRANRKKDDRRLQELIAGVRRRTGDCRSAGGHLRVERPSGRRAYAVMLAPAGPAVVDGGTTSPAILVFVSDPGGKIVSDLAVLKELFGFPPAEARLALALLSGVTMPEFASQAGVSYNTARTLLARALARTDTRSQTELAQLVARSIGGTIAPCTAASPSLSKEAW